MASFDNLPPEIMLKIFRYVNIFELMELRVCCKKWNRLIDDDSLYRAIRIDHTMNRNRLTNFIRRKPQLVKELNIDCMSFPDFKEVYVQLLKKLQNVKYVTLHASCENDLTIVMELLRAFNLQSFSLTVTTGALPDLNEMLSLLGDFRRLRITCFLYKFHQQLQLSLNNLRANELCLHSVLIETHELAAFCRRNAANLTKLKVRSWMLIHNPNELLFEPLALCTNLKTLTLGLLTLKCATDMGLNKLYKLKLQSLTLEYARFSSFGMSELFQHMRSLEKIALIYCKGVNSIVLEQIATSCKELVKFKYTHFGNKDYFEKEDILNIARNCPKLKVLRLRIGNEDAIELLNALTLLDTGLEEIRYTCRLQNVTPVLVELEKRVYSRRIIKNNIMYLEAAWFKKYDNRIIIRERGFRKFQQYLQGISKINFGSEFHWSA